MTRGPASTPAGCASGGSPYPQLLGVEVDERAEGRVERHDPVLARLGVAQDQGVRHPVVERQAAQVAHAHPYSREHQQDDLPLRIEDVDDARELVIGRR